MLDLARTEQTHRMLESSCGKGDIIDAILRLQPDVDLTAVEQNLTLQGVLTAKGYGDIVSYGDFLKYRGEYDRVLMNPPFEYGQDIDHIRHAYELLATLVISVPITIGMGYILDGCTTFRPAKPASSNSEACSSGGNGFDGRYEVDGGDYYHYESDSEREDRERAERDREKFEEDMRYGNY